MYWIEMDVDGDEGLGLDEVAAHCNRAKHCISYHVHMPSLIIRCHGQATGLVVWLGGMGGWQ